MGIHYTTTGTPFLVDAEFDDIIAEVSWGTLRNTRNSKLTSYIRANVRAVAPFTLLHRVLMGALPEEFVDHINGDGTDNRLCNLRIVTRTQNMWNAGIKCTSTVGFKGVRRAEYSKDFPWDARISCAGKRYFLGTFKTKEEAAMAYDRKAKELHGEFAKLNFGW